MADKPPKIPVAGQPRRVILNAVQTIIASDIHGRQQMITLDGKYKKTNDGCIWIKLPKGTTVQ